MRELKANLVRGPLPTNSVLVSETTSGNRHPETTSGNRHPVTTPELSEKTSGPRRAETTPQVSILSGG